MGKSRLGLSCTRESSPSCVLCAVGIYTAAVRHGKEAKYIFLSVFCFEVKHTGASVILLPQECAKVYLF